MNKNDFPENLGTIIDAENASHLAQLAFQLRQLHKTAYLPYEYRVYEDVYTHYIILMRGEKFVHEFSSVLGVAKYRHLVDVDLSADVR